MTITAGERHIIPRGTQVYDHKRKVWATRRVSYPVHVDRVHEGQVFWFGDCGRLMSCEAEDVNLSTPVGQRCPRGAG